MSVVDDVLGLLKKKPAELTLDDVKGGVLKLDRKSSEWERDAVAAEKKAAELREKAFTPGGQPADQTQFLRQSKYEAERAESMGNSAMVFINQMAGMHALLTTMTICDEFKRAGLIEPGTNIKDWQGTMDEMSRDIEDLIHGMQSIQIAVTDAMPKPVPIEAERKEQVELEALFARYNKTSDPVEKENIRKEIEKKAMTV